MKTLHSFILRSYIGPLSMTFFITLFILVMQFLWRYIDELVGKGLEFGVIAQLLFYATLQMVPMALPLAILLASLMTFGSLGENYELTALKSAGISLPRIMMPLIILTFAMSYGAYKFNNNVLPYINLKLYSLLFDVKQARPELEIKEKTFYSGIDGFTIKVEKKDVKADMLHKLMIYDQRVNTSSAGSVTIADSGRIKIDMGKSAAILTLYNGISYSEKVLDEKKRGTTNKQNFREDHFREQRANITLLGMDFNRTDEGLFKHNDKMKNIDQLTKDRDSLLNVKTKLINDTKRKSNDFYFLSWIYNQKITKKLPKDTINLNFNASTVVNPDSLFNTATKNVKKSTITTAIQNARNAKQSLDEQTNQFEAENKKIIMHTIEWHRKFTLSVACIIFFFIGAPLGAIIRKGGLGMPVVVSILFFIVYFVIDTFGNKMAREAIWDVPYGMWLSSALLMPIGIFLTYKSATDSTLLNADVYYHVFTETKNKVMMFFKKKTTTIKQ